MWQTAFFEKQKSPPTQEKHRELERAFSAWLTRRTATERVVFDGFAGAGRFADRDPLGSPLLLLQSAERCADVGRLRFVFVEKSPVNFARLCVALGAFLGQAEAMRYTTPSFVVEAWCGAFAEHAARLLSTPTSDVFSFIDPYGCDGVQLTTVAALGKRGDVVWHLATRALHTKLVSTTGASDRQARRMDALLGGSVPWATLRQEAVLRHDTAQLRRRLAEVAVAGLGQQGLRARLVPLSGGTSHLVCMARVAAISAPAHATPSNIFIDSQTCA